MAYLWRNNNACVATYKVLEGDQFLNQFEDYSIPFADAGVVKMGLLPYFPKTTNNAQIIEALAYEKAGKFLSYVQKIYTITLQNPFGPPPDIISNLAKIFANPAATVTSLAEAIDGVVSFPDEK